MPWPLAAPFRLFVFPVMHAPLGYAAAILIGSAAGMLMLGLLKEKKA